MSQAVNNIVNRTKSSVTGIEKMQHVPYRSEVTYPASGRVEKTKSTPNKMTQDEHEYAQ